MRGDTVGADVIHEHRVYLMKDFEEYGIGQITGAKVCRFFEDGVEYETARRRTPPRPEATIPLSCSMGNQTIDNPLEDTGESYRTGVPM